MCRALEEGGLGFRIQISNRPRIQITDEVVIFRLLGFKFQCHFLGSIFQIGWDSGFRFQMAGIQDSNYVFRGPMCGVFLDRAKALFLS